MLLYIFIITQCDHSHTVKFPFQLSNSLMPVQGKKEMFYLTTHSTHFIYSHMVSDILLRTILIVRKETRCHHIGYSFRLAARVLLYAPSHRQDSTFYTAFVTPVVEHWLEREIAQWVHSMKDRSDDPSHHEQTLLPWSYISLLPVGETSTGVWCGEITSRDRTEMKSDRLNCSSRINLCTRCKHMSSLS